MMAEIIEEVNDKIEINLKQETHDSLISIFVMDKLSETSFLVFNDYLEDGYEICEALGAAVINEMANIALREELENGTFAETIKELQDSEEE